MARNHTSNYYELLQVSENASPEMIRHAHKLLSGKLTPYLESNQKEQAKRRIEALDRAVHILNDPERRSHYDAWLKMQRDKRRQEHDLQYDAHPPRPDHVETLASERGAKPSPTKKPREALQRSTAPNASEHKESHKNTVKTASSNGSDTSDGSGSQTHPWRRFWARLFDSTLMIFALYFILLSIESPSGIPTSEGKLNGAIFLAPLLLIFIEPIMLEIWGTTPGKAMLGISIERRDGSRLRYSAGMSRSLKVWFRGLGMNLPLISWITLVVAYQNLKTNGETSWDRDGLIDVRHKKIGFQNWFGFLLATLIVIFIGASIANLILQK